MPRTSRFQFLLAPRWLAFHAFIVAALIVCTVLGWWQLGAFRDSSARHDLRDADPVPLTSLVQPGAAIGDAADRAVTITGTYVEGAQRWVPGRVSDGVLGSYLVTPLETADGLVVPVLRGWMDDRGDATPPSGQVTGTGHLLSPESRDQATVRTGQPLEEDEVAYLAPDQIAAATGIGTDRMVDGYVVLSELDASAPTDLERLDVDAVAPIRDVNPWQNLSYWGQWWVFGIAALVFWGSAVRSAMRRQRRDEVSEPEHSPEPSEPRTARR